MDGRTRFLEDPSLEGCFTGDVAVHPFQDPAPGPLQRLPDWCFLKPMPSPDAGMLTPGSYLDKYRIDGRIGSGGFADVFQAQHLVLKKPVAIKVVRPALLVAHPRMAEALCEEAVLAAGIDHPNVVRIHDATRSQEWAYVVMEYVDGPSLGELYKRHRRMLDPSGLLQVIADCVRGLGAALRHDLVHCDIKPANILLTRSGQAKICDLGLARRIDQSGNADRIMGTPWYMAPEQVIPGSRIDFRTDIYGLGANLYLGLTGAHPVPGDEAHEVLGRLNSHIPEPPSARAACVLPPQLDELVLSMLAKDPRGRPGSYAELLTALEHCRQLLQEHSRPSSLLRLAAVL